MSTARKAREWLAAQDGPRTSRQIADAVGGNTLTVQQSVGWMLRDGLLNRVSAKKPCTYVVAREGKTTAESAAIALEARRARAASKAGIREQERAQAAFIRRGERERASAERKHQRAIDRKEADKARRQEARARFAAKLESKSVANPAPVIQAQTVEEWMAMGGHVERVSSSWNAHA